jgi:nickel transport protein
MVIALLLAGPASAHEVLHTVEHGRAVAVKAYFPDAEPLAYAEFQVFSPADSKIPYAKGRTDRSGYLAFVPDVPGAWQVKVSEASGHGLALEVTVDSPGAEQGKPVPPAGLATWGFVLRPILGVALIAAVFVALGVLYRRRKTGR